MAGALLCKGDQIWHFKFWREGFDTVGQRFCEPLPILRKGCAGLLGQFTGGKHPLGSGIGEEHFLIGRQHEKGVIGVVQYRI